jgi:hypothetical protein
LRNTYNKFIFGDMSAIRRHGIKSFEDNYFWPISDVEFDKFVRHMHNSYIELISNIDDDYLYDIALIELNFVHYLMQVFHYNYVQEYAKENKIKLLVGDDSSIYRNPDWTQLGVFYSTLEFPFGKIIRFIRRIVKNIYFNKHLSVVEILKGFFHKDKIINIGSMNFIKMEFIRKRKIFVKYCDWIDVIDLKNKESTIQNNNSLFFKENIVSIFLSNIGDNGNLFVKNIDFLELEKSWTQRFNDLSNLYYSLIDVDSEVDTLLVSDMAKPIPKLITMSFQRKKIDVFCFHHGNDACYSKLSLASESTVCHSRKFITPTKGINNRYKKHYLNNVIAKRSNIKFISINSNYYTKLFSKRNYINNSNVNKIMLMGFPLNSHRYSYENNLFFYKMISLEYRIIIALKEAGYHVLYKVHPDREQEAKGIFNNFVDEYIPKPFENTWQKADLLLFTYTSTTTFGHALTTNLPIVLIDSAKKSRDIDDYELMRSRINILPAKVDDKMKIKFNKGSLINIISNDAINNFDFSYVDQILGKQ